ncbi:NAD-dependent epimerase/dehydratase family protein, partial [Rhizobium leguminosarum]|uniref:NAD-dependent epimerase/dehydratase family protein n=1 Tax=Rhizobium leguminosarum TaxID=384 RepID=UPI003F9CCBFA
VLATKVNLHQWEHTDHTRSFSRIYANNTYQVDFIYDNLMIELNVMEAEFRTGVRKLLLLGSSCIYPKLYDQPIKEDALLT